MEFGEKLRKLRKDAGLSQEMLASQLGVSRQAVSIWENGQGYPETDKMLAISALFSVSLDWLLKENPSEEAPDEEPGYYVSRETAEGYISMKAAGARRIAVGVGIIIFSLSFAMLFKEAYGTVLFLLGVAVGVAVLILQGFSAKPYRALEEQPLVFDPVCLGELKARAAAYSKVWGGMVAAGVVLVILSFALAMLGDNVAGMSERWNAVLPPIWAIAVGLFILAGSGHAALNVLVNNNEHTRELQKEKAKERYGWVYGVGMPIAAAIFLAIGFLWHAWHPGWLVFPVMAAICGGIVQILRARE